MEQVAYVTCPRGHKIFVTWSPQRKLFSFTCDECQESSLKAVSEHGVIAIQLVRPA